MNREEKIALLKKVEAGADIFNELNKDQVIIFINGKYSLNGKEITEEQAKKFTGLTIRFKKKESEDFLNA